MVCGTIDTLADQEERYAPGDAQSLGVVGDVVCWLGSENELACGRAGDDYFLGGGPFVQLSANEFAFVAVGSSRRVSIAPLQADGEVTGFEELAGLVIPTSTFELVGSGAGWCAFDDEDAHCWIGDNSRGQLGLGTRNNDAVADVTDLGGAGGYRDVVFGLAHGCGVDGDEVWCWGSNHRGQVRPDETSAAFEPAAASL